MLSPSWQGQGSALRMGERVRTNHDCGGGRTLTIRRDERGLHAHCFRCNDSGWVPPEPEPLSVRLERLRKQHEVESLVCRTVDLPEPQVRAWVEWPPECRLWLLKAGLCSADLPGLGAYYHPPTNRVVLTVFDPFLRPLFWQARAVDKRVPKYIAPPVNKASIVPKYGKADRITLTEDILSAYKVGLVGEGWSLMGTSISRSCLAAILATGKEVNVWLDPDQPGQRAATKVLAELRGLGVTCKNIISQVDPKLVHRADIKELIT